MRTLIPRVASAIKKLLFRPATQTPTDTATQPVDYPIQPEALQQPPKPTFIEVLGTFMKHETAVKNLKKNTQDKHGYHFNNITGFLTEYGLLDLQIDQVRIRHMDDLREWLHTNVKQPNGESISLDHSTRHLRMCRNACDYAVRKEYISSNTITAIETKRSPEKEVVYLTISDVRRFERYHSDTIPQRNVIRDLFLFQCYTGLSYMDLWLYQVIEDFVLDEKSGAFNTIYWVSCSSGRGKTQRRYWAEYTEKAAAIRKKYKGEFPHISLQTYNRSIKKMAKELGVQTYITTHIGRKTFANLKRYDGYSTPAIAAMLGNTEEIARKHYVAMGPEVILAERKRLSAA